MDQPDISAVVARMPQAILIVGDNQQSTYDVFREQVKDSGYEVIELDQEALSTATGSLGVDFIRRLQELSKTKSVRPRLFIVRDAHKITHQAQNAFLKLLEEPGSDIHFVLTATSKSSLLPTVLSRVQLIRSPHLSKSHSIKLIEKHGVKDSNTHAQMMFLAEGLEDELSSLASNKDYFEKRVGRMKNAKTLISGSRYQKMIVINSYKDDRSAMEGLIDDVCKILRSSSLSSPQKQNFSTIDKLLEAKQNIDQNGNPRIWVMRAVL